MAEIAELRERLATATTATKTAPSADDEAKEIERERALAAADERLAQLEDLNAALEKEAAGAKALAAASADAEAKSKALAAERWRLLLAKQNARAASESTIADLRKQARSPSHWSPYDRVRVVNAVS